jgi:hypothetical protein
MFLFLKKIMIEFKFYILKFLSTLLCFLSFYTPSPAKVRNIGSFYLFLYFCLGVVGIVYIIFLFSDFYMFASLETLDLSDSNPDFSKIKNAISESMHRRKLCRYRAAQAVLTLIILLTSLF